MDEEIRALYLPGTFLDRTRLKLRRRKEGEGKLDERSVSEVRERETEIITRRYFIVNIFVLSNTFNSSLQIFRHLLKSI